jgi:phosphatidylglycerophosphate synthase
MYAKYKRLLDIPKLVLAILGSIIIISLWAGAELPMWIVLLMVIFLVMGLNAAAAVDLLYKAGVKPDHLTITGLLMSIIAVYPLMNGRLLIGISIVGAASVLDVLDGHMARRHDITSKRGELLDSVLDRVSDAAVFAGFTLYFQNKDQSVWAVLSLAALCGSFCVSYIRAKAEKYMSKCEVGFGGERPDRLIALLLTSLLGIPEIGVAYVVVFSWATAARRMYAALNYLK